MEPAAGQWVFKGHVGGIEYGTDGNGVRVKADQHGSPFYVPADYQKLVRQMARNAQWIFGLGRYDIMIEPKKPGHIAFIIEFKVVNAKRRETLEDGVKAALQQIEEKFYCKLKFR